MLSKRARLILLVGIAAGVIGHCSLAQYATSRQQPLAYWLLYWSCVSVVAWQFPKTKARDQKNGKVIFMFLLAVASLWCFLNVLECLYQSVSAVDGVDLFYYVCLARDRVWGYETSQVSVYTYFPGFFRFWQVIIFVFGSKLFVIQSAVIGLLLLNAILVCLIVKTTTKIWQLGLVGFALYVSFALRFEGLSGTSEPLATIGYLLGVWSWTICKGYHRPKISSILLGIGLGLALFCKEQAGLLSIGAVWLLFFSSKNQAVRSLVVDFGITALTASIVFIVLILLEGRGLFPLTTGLNTAMGYPAEWSWLRNIISQIRNDESLAWVSVLSISGIAFSLFKTRVLTDREHEICGLLVLSAIATLVQFRSQGNFHYCLLAIPGFAAAFLIQATAYYRSIHSDCWKGRQKKIAIVMSVVLPFLYCGQRNVTLCFVDAECILGRIAPSRAWHETSEIANDLKEFERLVEPRSTMAILPINRTAIYFRLNTVDPLGYAFSNRSAEISSTSEPIRFVVALKPPMTRSENIDWNGAECDKRLQNFIDHGYYPIAIGNRLKLLRAPFAFSEKQTQ